MVALPLGKTFALEHSCSTERVMVTNAYHYPLTIASHSFVALFVSYILALYLGSESSNTPGKQYSQLRIRQEWTMTK